MRYWLPRRKRVWLLFAALWGVAIAFISLQKLVLG